MWAILGLTLREAVRRRAFIGTLLILLVMYGLSFLPGAFRRAFNTPQQYEMGIQITILFGLDIIKFFSSILAILLCSGAITSEIERGYLAVILPKPLQRFEIYFGKWLGVMLFCFANAVLWMVLLWISVNLQSTKPHHEMWRALPLVLLYPILYGTVALACSSFASAPLAALFTTTLGAYAYVADHILRPLAALFDIDLLKRVVYWGEWVLPMARLKRLVEQRMDVLLPPGMGEPPPWAAEEVVRFLKPAVTPFDLPYVLVYLLAWFLLGSLVFQRRDLQ